VRELTRLHWQQHSEARAEKLKEVDINLISLLDNIIASLEEFDLLKTLKKLFLNNNLFTSASLQNFPNL
jgi:hypothetical protein